MFNDKLKNLDTLDVQSKKKKNILVFLAIGGVSIILLISIVSAFLEVNSNKIYKNRIEKEKIEGLQVIQSPEFKETWAISMENRIDKQEKKTTEVIEQLASKQEVAMNELKDLIKNSIDKNDNNVRELSTSVENQITGLKEDFESKIAKQNENIEQINIQNEDYKLNQNLNKDNVIGANLLPNEDKGEDQLIIMVGEGGNTTIKEDDKNKKNPLAKSDLDKMLEDELKNVSSKVLEGNVSKSTGKVEDKPTRKKITIMDVDTSFNKEILSAQVNIEKEKDVVLDEKAEMLKTNFHLSTGLTQAYMITGAYAPAFQDSDSEPLPVLLEAEGDIILANDQVATVEKCLFLGSAKGNMNSQTATIKLASISCLLSDSKYRLEGPVNGWVIGENGIPGVHGELLHKNGAWLARTFVSGFLETFSNALGGSDSTTIQIGGEASTGAGTAIKDNIGSASAQGAATVFGKIGDYYLKMAEQIFPIIEVKGGRTVDIMLIGEQDLSLVENNKLDINDITDHIEQIELNKLKKDDTISDNNAFTQTVLKNNDTSSIVIKGDKNDK